MKIFSSYNLSSFYSTFLTQKKLIVLIAITALSCLTVYFSYFVWNTRKITLSQNKREDLTNTITHLLEGKIVDFIPDINLKCSLNAEDLDTFDLVLLLTKKNLVKGIDSEGRRFFILKLYNKSLQDTELGWVFQKNPYNPASKNQSWALLLKRYSSTLFENDSIILKSVLLGHHLYYKLAD